MQQCTLETPSLLFISTGCCCLGEVALLATSHIHRTRTILKLLEAAETALSHRLPRVSLASDEQQRSIPRVGSAVRPGRRGRPLVRTAFAFERRWYACVCQWVTLKEMTCVAADNVSLIELRL
jgi:hypothetical protein